MYKYKQQNRYITPDNADKPHGDHESVKKNNLSNKQTNKKPSHKTQKQNKGQHSHINFTSHVYQILYRYYTSLM